MSKERSCYFELLQSKKIVTVIISNLFHLLRLFTKQLQINSNTQNNITIKKKKYIYEQIKININIKISNMFIVRGANSEIINP